MRSEKRRTIILRALHVHNVIGIWRGELTSISCVTLRLSQIALCDVPRSEPLESRNLAPCAARIAGRGDLRFALQRRRVWKRRR